MTAGYSRKDVTLDAVRAGDVDMADIRISAAALIHQAEVAEAHANPQLGANLRRAAELTGFTDDEVMAVYESLRPRRSSYDELCALADSFAARSAPLVAALLAEAAQVYRRRDLLQA